MPNFSKNEQSALELFFAFNMSDLGVVRYLAADFANKDEYISSINRTNNASVCSISTQSYNAQLSE